MIKHGLTDRDESLRQAKKLKGRVGEYEKTLSETEGELLELGLGLPNWSDARSPIGGEEKAVEIERFGRLISREEEENGKDDKRDHLALAVKWGLMDNDASSTVTGSSWPYLKGLAAVLEHALVGYALSIAIRRGWTPVATPDVVRQDIAWRCGFQPRDPSNSTSTQTYHLQTEEGAPELCLAGTAEIPLGGIFANRVLEYEALPVKVVGIGKAFRAEAGARGADTRGLYRVHQFTKVELFGVCEGGVGGEGEKLMEEIKEVQREVAQGLGLSVR